MKHIIEKISKIKNGFKPIEIEAQQISKSRTISDAINLSYELLKNETFQIRCFAVFILGFTASKDFRALNILKTEVCNDSSWQVQEVLAKAFDQFCKENGYEKSFPIINDWLNDKNPNVCRAVTEGLRIWTNHPYFKENPKTAIKLISIHKNSDSEFLRKSVGNSLRDISKKHSELVDNEISGWDLTNRKINFTYKYVIKNRKI